MKSKENVKNKVFHSAAKHKKTNHQPGYHKAVVNPTTNYPPDTHQVFCARCKARNGQGRHCKGCSL